MKTMRLIALAVALVAVSSAAAGTAPRVGVDGISPLVVVGAGFDHSAAVKVTVAAGDQRLAKTVRSTPTGTFRAAWRTSLHRSRCEPFVVSAASATKHAIWKAVVSRTCPPPPTP